MRAAKSCKAIVRIGQVRPEVKSFHPLISKNIERQPLKNGATLSDLLGREMQLDESSIVDYTCEDARRHFGGLA